MSRFYKWQYTTKTWKEISGKRYHALLSTPPQIGVFKSRMRLAEVEPPSVPVKTRQVVIVVYPNGWACVKNNEDALFSLYQTSTRD